jgi:hypothetical protein
VRRCREGKEKRREEDEAADGGGREDVEDANFSRCSLG